MATNDKYQSTFMPKIQKAETKIKLLILAAFLYATSLYILRNQIDGVLYWLDKQIPQDLKDRQAYIKGLKASSERFILLYYKKPQIGYKIAKESLIQSVPKGKTPPTIKNPKELLDLTSNPKNLWAEAKGVPNVVDYPNALKKKMEELAQAPATTYEPGKKPISLWQKAELEVRYDAQMKMLDDLRNSGVQYAWTSSHPNCSKRCEPWQGKLMDINNHAKGPNHQVTTIEGNPVYSLVDIMAKTDKYGYHNNIICGFNCRHKLIPFKPGKYGPKEYSEKDVAKQRAIEERIRTMERTIRAEQVKARLFYESGQIKIANEVQNRVKILIAKYKAFCEHHGYAWNEYRISA